MALSNKKNTSKDKEKNTFNYKAYTASKAVTDAEKKMQTAQKDYKPSAAVNSAKKAWNAHQKSKVNSWTGGTFGEQLKQAMSDILGRKEFSYDVNGDALFQQYKDQYVTQGENAMLDTVGQAAALTGGYGSSYAVTAGNQAYQSYLQQLNNKVPELYQLALDRYETEGQDLYDRYGMLRSEYDAEYGRHRDSVADWENTDEKLYGRYSDEKKADYDSYLADRDYYAGRYDTERDIDYGRYTDGKEFAYDEYLQELARQQWEKEFGEGQRQFDAEFSEGQRQFDLEYALALQELENSKKANASGGNSSSGKSGSSGGGSKSVTNPVETKTVSDEDKRQDELAQAAYDMFKANPGVKIDSATVSKLIQDKGLNLTTDEQQDLLNYWAQYIRDAGENPYGRMADPYGGKK